MESKFEKILENLEEEETLIIGDKTFLNEMIFDESIQCSIFGTLTFFEVDFKRIDFTGSTFVNCEFKNCRFKDVILRKCEFWNPTFENCQIERSNLTRANFHKGSFRNCNFLNANLSASHFSDFEFIETKFNSSDLDLIGARSIKVSRSNQSIEIANSLNLEKTLKDMNLLEDRELDSRIEAEIKADFDINLNTSSDNQVRIERMFFFGLAIFSFYLFMKSGLFEIIFNFI